MSQAGSVHNAAGRWPTGLALDRAAYDGQPARPRHGGEHQRERSRVVSQGETCRRRVPAPGSQERAMRRTSLIAIVLLAGSLTVNGQGRLPRPEYPQPQFERSQWMNLNGAWQFEFDDKNIGLDEGWAASARAFSRTITVPFSFESRASGIGDTSFHPWVWYRRSVAIPAEWTGKRVLLRFGAVDYRAQVWVNGQLAGAHEGGHTPFEFDVTALLKPGSNAVTVRTEDPPTDRSIPRGKQYWELKSRGVFYTRTTGIWQTVWMEAVGSSYLEAVAVSPSLDGVVRLDARIARPQAGLEFRATVRLASRVVATTTVPTSEDRALAALTIENPTLWLLAKPTLYDITFELLEKSSVVDRVFSYFAFRTVSAGDGRVLLNGRPVFLKLVLDQGYWPETVLTPPSDEAIQADIKFAKDMGFNGARKHQKIEDPRFLYWADRLGYLVQSEMPNAFVFNASAMSRITREWIEALERDRQHPSIIIWAPINESWGLPDLDDARQQAHLRELYWLTKAFDPTRLVIDNEGWGHTEATDLFAMHYYAPNGEILYQTFKDLGKPGVPISTFGRRALLPGVRYNGSPFTLSEFGGIRFIPPGHQFPPDTSGNSVVEKTREAALERMRGLYAAVARIPTLAGVCYTQLTDVEQEVNGLLTDDRKPKFELEAIREMNALLK
jgi:beta-galactosidase/beta-glucuronidase